MKRILRSYLIWRWGFRGGLKPPLGYPPEYLLLGPIPVQAKLAYRWRYFCWKIENALYTWSGIPERFNRLMWRG